MGALGIIAGILAMLSTAGITAFAVITLATGKGNLVSNILVVCGGGLLFLAQIFAMIGVYGTLVVAAILGLLGWPALAAGLLFVYLPLWQRPTAAAPAAE